MENESQSFDNVQTCSLRSPVKLRSRSRKLSKTTVADGVKIGKESYISSPVDLKRKRNGLDNCNSSRYFSDTNSPKDDFFACETPGINQLNPNNQSWKGEKLDSSFYNIPCAELARSLLGKVLVRKLPSGELLKGKIVETECYLGVDDKASHSYNGKQTDRNSAMFMKPGTSYVYSIYGMYYCFNISSKEDGSAVLIRSLEPLENLELMRRLRSLGKKSSITPVKDRDLCNGPSKLCQALDIDKNSLNKRDLANWDSLWVENNECVLESDIVVCKRIGIESAGAESANKPLRFYVRNCMYVSVRNKAAENNVCS